jgi:glycosyltransferase involved in cell wall biosynthesis
VKIAYVTPRYGEQIVGGAEHAARMLAERLVGRLGWDVEVLTSCALDASTWKNEVSPGSEIVNGVSVRRFPVAGERHKEFLHLSWRMHNNPRLADMADQRRWVEYQGPLMPDLLPALDATDADVVVFYPYLYYPTVFGIPRVAARSVMHPAAHDEASIRMTVYSPVFAQTSAFVFQTDGERRLTERMFPIADKPQLLLGLGVEPVETSDAQIEQFRAKYGLGDDPYLICVGRVDEGKGSFLLAKYFAQYKHENPGPTKLLYIGPPVQKLPTHRDIVVAGVVSDDEKWAALRGSSALISPSPFEAFSLALIEGWAAQKPVMVNGACLATREHVERSGGGLWFNGYYEFNAGLRRLESSPALAAGLASAGHRYVSSRFHWPVLIERYATFLEQVASRTAKKAS